MDRLIGWWSCDCFMINLRTKGCDSGYLVVLSYGFNIWSPWNVQANLINDTN